MPVSFANISASVASRVRADQSAPTLDNLHENSLVRWINESIPRVVRMVKDLDQFQELIVRDTSIAINSGTGDGSLPADYEYRISVRVGATSRFTRLMDADEFTQQDGAHFLSTPTADFPAAYIGGDVISVKPITSGTALLDYIRQHTTFTNASTTVFGSLADEVLIELVAAKTFEFLKLNDRATRAENRAKELAA